MRPLIRCQCSARTHFKIVVSANRSQDSIVGIAPGYGLDDQGVEVRVPVWSRIFLLHVVQTGHGVHPTSYPISTGGSFHGVKAAWG
jgi:hypothetical protein